jgi:phage-related protein
VPGSFAKSNLDKSSKDLRDKRLLTFNSDKLTRVDLSAKGTYEFGKKEEVQPGTKIFVAAAKKQPDGTKRGERIV